VDDTVGATPTDKVEDNDKVGGHPSRRWRWWKEGRRTPVIGAGQGQRPPRQKTCGPDIWPHMLGPCQNQGGRMFVLVW
jgi:hypothetical protein